MDSARMICYVLRKLEQDRGETIRLDYRELAAIRPQDVLVEIAKLSGTPSGSPSLEPPTPPSQSGRARHRAGPSLRHCNGNRRDMNRPPNEQAHAPAPDRQQPSGTPQAPEARLPLASEWQSGHAYLKPSNDLCNRQRARTIDDPDDRDCQ